MHAVARGAMIGALAASLTAVGDGFRNPPEGAAALGKAGVKSVFVEDASAVSHNPARLTELKQAELQAALTLGYTTAEYSSPAGDAETESPLKLLPNVYYAAPLGAQGWTAAIGVTTPYGQSTEWEKDGIFRYSVPYFAEMSMIDLMPTVARKFESLSIGVGLDVYAAQLTMRQMVPWSAVLGAPVPDGRLEVEGDGAALGAHAGAVYQIGDRSAVGLTWHSSFTMEFEGDTDVSGLVPGLPPPLSSLSPHSDFETETEFPNIVTLGYGLQATEALRVEAQVEWLEHSRYQDLTLDLGNNGLLLPQSTIPQDWDDTWTFGVGADWTYADGRVLRAGYAFVESPIPDETFSPTIPDADRHVLALGWGAQVGQGWWDLAYAYSLLEDREIRNNQNPAFNGDYSFEPHLVSLSYRRGF